MKPGIPEGVRVRRSILKPFYRVDGVGYDTVVEGVSTAALAGALRAGDSIWAVARAWQLNINLVHAALRWELHDRRWRLARVREHLR